MLLRKKEYERSGSLGKLAWKRFKKDKAAFISLIFILLISLVCVFGYVISADHSPMVNEQNLLLATEKPGFEVQILKIRKNQSIPERNSIHYLLYGKENIYSIIPIISYTFSSDSIIVIEYNSEKRLAYHLTDVSYPIAEGMPLQKINGNLKFRTIENRSITTGIIDLQNQIKAKQLQTRTYWLGTDRYGRDVLSQLIIGARVSLSVGFIAVAISLLIGIFMGATAGYFGGKIDAFISWLINVIWAVPTLLLVIAITFALGKGFWQVFIAVGLTMWVEVARVVRGQFLSLREREFVEAARALGYRDFSIIFHQILPNAMAPVIVISAANFASAILLEAGLSFLGIGVQPPMPSWGVMIKENYAYIILDYPYLAILPGVAIMLVVLAFMLIGNGLRDALDVKSK